jgi:ElaB/YqjD/DUF883 family membrane-anchored ribosome-binding protein
MDFLENPSQVAKPRRFAGLYFDLGRRSGNNPTSSRFSVAHPENLDLHPAGPRQEDSEMTSANQSVRQASPSSRQAAETAKSIGEEVSDIAGDVGRMASKQYGRAQDMAVDAFDETHAAIKRNPLLSIAIALGVGFMFGVVLTSVRQ